MPRARSRFTWAIRARSLRATSSGVQGPFGLGFSGASMGGIVGSAHARSDDP